MNPFIAISLIGGDLKKYMAVALATVAFITILPVMAVFSMGGDAVSFLSDSPSASSAEEQGFYMGGAIPGDTYAWGNCTYWVFGMRLWANRPIPTSWGNADTWDNYAIRDGYLVDRTPAIGAVMQSDAGGLGHVAYVTDVNPISGEWKISEMNAPRLNVVSTRTFNKAAALSFSFIHNKKVNTP